jgi:hypothetical protein
VLHSLMISLKCPVRCKFRRMTEPSLGLWFEIGELKTWLTGES